MAGEHGYTIDEALTRAVQHAWVRIHLYVHDVTDLIALLRARAVGVTVAVLAALAAGNLPVIHRAPVALQPDDIGQTGALPRAVVAIAAVLVRAQNVAHASWKQHPTHIDTQSYVLAA